MILSGLGVALPIDGGDRLITTSDHHRSVDLRVPLMHQGRERRGLVFGSFALSVQFFLNLYLIRLVSNRTIRNDH